LEHEIALERLVESAGVKFAHHGAHLIGAVSLHDDREPSLAITRTCCRHACGFKLANDGHDTHAIQH
jgi:hypothetical protein